MCPPLKGRRGLEEFSLKEIKNKKSLHLNLSISCPKDGVQGI
jgi:hypothetical protein